MKKDKRGPFACILPSSFNFISLSRTSPYIFFIKVFLSTSLNAFLRDRHQEMDINLMPRKGMHHVRAVMIIANPYTEDSLKKYNSVEVLLPKTGEVSFLCKLPQSLYTPGKYL